MVGLKVVEPLAGEGLETELKSDYGRIESI